MFDKIRSRWNRLTVCVREPSETIFGTIYTTYMIDIANLIELQFDSQNGIN